MDGNSGSDNPTVTGAESSNDAVNLLPGQVNADPDTPSTTTSENDSNSTVTTESRNDIDESDEVRCPRCGSTFVEQSRVPITTDRQAENVADLMSISRSSFFYQFCAKIYCRSLKQQS